MPNVVERLAAGSIQPLAAVLAVYYAVLAVSHSQFLEPPASTWMSAIAALTTAAAAVVLWRARAGALQAHGHLGIVFLATLALANSLAHLAATGEPRQSSSIGLVLLGCGLLLFSWRWLAVFIAVSASAWLWIAASWPNDADWTHYAFLIFSSALLAATTFTIRMRALRSVERMRAAANEAELEAKARQLQKAESLSVLAGGVAHDLNNALVGVLGNADLASSSLPPDHAARAYVDAIHDSGERASELAGQLLHFSGKGRFVSEPISLPAILAEMERTLHGIMPEPVQLEVDIAPDVPTVEGDPLQVATMIENLVINGADAAADSGSSVRVELGRFEGRPQTQDDFVHGAETPPGVYATIRVRDDGPGLDAATRERMFDPFYTTKNAGRGLGLAVVSGIVRAHGGAILVGSQRHDGASVTVLLPSAQVSAAPQPDATNGVATGRGATVLVADDDPAVRWVAREALRNAGHRVIEAKNGLEALERFRNGDAEIELVLLDATMPMMGGGQVVAEVRDARARFILTCGHGDEVPKDVGDRLSGVLRKPFGAAELVAIVEKTLAGEQPDRLQA